MGLLFWIIFVHKLALTCGRWEFSCRLYYIILRRSCVRTLGHPCFGLYVVMLLISLVLHWQDTFLCSVGVRWTNSRAAIETNWFVSNWRRFFSLRIALTCGRGVGLCKCVARQIIASRCVDEDYYINEQVDIDWMWFLPSVNFVHMLSLTCGRWEFPQVVIHDWSTKLCKHAWSSLQTDLNILSQCTIISWFVVFVS